MSQPVADPDVLSREELDSLLAEMPRLLAARVERAEGTAASGVDFELERANEAFGAEWARSLSNRHERVIGCSMIGQRAVELRELAELMLPTDVVGTFQIAPKGATGMLLLSRPFFFQMLCVLFGSGANVKPIRPPTRDYTRIERRFYARIVREMLGRLEEQWQALAPVTLAWSGIQGRAAVAEAGAREALLATFDVKGFGDACRLRLAVPPEAFGRAGAVAARPAKTAASAGVSLLEVPIRLRAQVGTAELPLGEVGRLRVGQSIALDVPADGSLTVRIGEREKFRGIAGTRGAKRAVKLQERIEGAE